MTTKNSSYSRIIAVWMVLFALLGGMAFPSFVQAKVDMTIATEGDPGDGMDFAGGGGGGFDGNDNNAIPNDDLDNIATLFPIFLDQSKPNFIFSQTLIPMWVNGQLRFVVVIDFGEWRAIR